MIVPYSENMQTCVHWVPRWSKLAPPTRQAVIENEASTPFGRAGGFERPHILAVFTLNLDQYVFLPARATPSAAAVSIM